MGKKQTRFYDDLPDDILPSQFFLDRPSNGETILCAAVLWDALEVMIGDLPEYMNQDREECSMWQRDWAWLHSDSRSYVHSFGSICDTLGIDALDVRRHVKQAIVQKRYLPRRHWRGVQRRCEMGA